VAWALCSAPQARSAVPKAVSEAVASDDDDDGREGWVKGVCGEKG